MAFTRDLAYYGGNANNQRYLEGLAAAKAAAKSAPAIQASTSNVRSQEIAAAQALLAQLQADESELTPPVPQSAPAWKAKA